MAIEVFWGSGSPYAWRVLLALEYKRIAYDSHPLQFSKQEHKSPQMLRMNPRGRVPVIAVHGPTNPVKWGPWGDGHIVISSPFLCRPCGQDGCLGSKRSDCLEAISPGEVLAAAETLLGRTLRASA